MNLIASVKAWWHVYIIGLFKPEEITNELTIDELMEKYFPEDEDEWEEDAGL